VSPILPQAQVETLLDRNFLEILPDAMIAVDNSGKILQVNAQTEALFGYTRDELLGQSVEVLVSDAHRPAHAAQREKFTQSPRLRPMGEGLDLRGRRKDGSEFPVEISLSPVSSGSETLVLSAIRDVTRQKSIENELRRAHQELDRRTTQELGESRARLAAIIDSSDDAILSKDLNGTIMTWNRGAERFYGYTPEEAIGNNMLMLAPPDRHAEIAEIMDRIRRGEHIHHYESVRVTKDGKRVDVSISIAPLRDAAGNVTGASTIARDITAQKRAEGHLHQAQKMEAIGRLAGGVAHDFNNVLGIITACTELLRSRIAAEAPSLQYVENIRKAAERGASLTRQLLVFSRRQPLQSQILDLNERLRETNKLLRPLMGDDVEIILKAQSRAALIEADAGQLDQILINLALNARDAMPHGGRFILQTGVVQVDDAFARQHHPMRAGNYVLLAASDTGIGMDEATQVRIFEPFFTTKEAGKGTGLGLATVYSIIKQSGGHIWVYSELGRGTTLKIYLPSAEHKVRATRLRRSTPSPRRVRKQPYCWLRTIRSCGSSPAGCWRSTASPCWRRAMARPPCRSPPIPRPGSVCCLPTW
jgi:PAS domain S-box-containing protein